MEHRTVQRELALNGQEHVFVRASELVGTSVREEDFLKVFKPFGCSKVCANFTFFKWLVLMGFAS